MHTLNSSNREYKQMKDNKSYTVTLPGASRSETWDSAKFERNKEKLYSKYPDVAVQENSIYNNSDNEGIVEGDSYTVTLPGASRSETWDSAKFSRNREKLYSKYPDASVTRIREYSYQNTPAQQHIIGGDAISQVLPAQPDAGNTESLKEEIVDNSYMQQYRRYLDSQSALIDKMSKDIANQRSSELSGERSKRDDSGFWERLGAHNPYPQVSEDSKNYEAAQRLLTDAKKIINAPHRDDDSGIVKGFLQGAGDTMSDVDFYTLGLTEIQDNLQLRGALEKVQNKIGNIKDLSEEQIDEILTPSEQALVQAFVTNAIAQQERAENVGRAYRSGTTFAESIPFMAEFALTGGIGKAASEGAKKAMTSWLAKKIGNIGQGFAQSIVRKAGKAAIGAVNMGIRTVVQSALSPSTARNISEQLTTITEEGKLNDANKAFVDGAIDNIIEINSEMMGSALMKGIAAPFKSLMPSFAKNAASNVISKINKAPWYKAMKAGGWNGLPEEMLEEWYGNSLRALTGNTEALKDFATVDQQLVTLGAFIPMTAIGGSVSTAQYIAANKRMKNAAAALKNVLMDNGYTEDQANYLADYTRIQTPRQMSDNLTPIINQLSLENDTQAASDMTKAAFRYMEAVQRYQTYDGIYQEQEGEQRQAMQDEIQGQLGGSQFWQDRPLRDGYTTREVTMAATADGDMVYVVSQPDENGQVAVIYGDGRKGFANQSELVDGATQDMDTYLSSAILTKREQEDAARMEADREQQIADIQASATVGSQINLNTQESPVMAQIIQVTPDGVIAQPEDGSAPRFLSWTEYGQMTGQQPVVQSQASMDNDEADRIVAEQEERIASTDGTITISQEEEVVPEQGSTDTAEEIQAEQENVLRNPSGYILPVREDGKVNATALWNDNPAEWAVYNDRRIAEKFGRSDKGASSMQYINNAISTLDKTLKQLEKERKSVTDFDEMESIEDEIIATSNRIQALNDVLSAYAPKQEVVTTAAEQTFGETQRQEQAQQAIQQAESGFPSIQARWNNAQKIEGSEDQIILPDGTPISGRYILTDAFSPTASHDPESGFAMSEGFPVDENGKTVNDRDYQNDKEAQEIVMQRAADYDSRALQSPVIVSSDGVVLSGNDRTMASQVAARKNTDRKYTDYLSRYAQKYGFTPEQVTQFSNPRVVFVPDESLPYNTATFAKFNQRETKGQNKTETAVKAGKVMSDETMSKIAGIVDGFDTISEVYRDSDATRQIIDLLVQNGAITANDVPSLMSGDQLSGAGEDLIESILTGNILAEDALRIAMSDRAIRRAILSAIGSIIANRSIPEYSLTSELSDAVVLLGRAKREYGLKQGEDIAEYMRQQNLFGKNPVAEATVQILADSINKREYNTLRKVLSFLNEEGGLAASGQLDIFTGDTRGKQDILTEILNNLGYETRTAETTAAEPAGEQVDTSAQGVSESDTAGQIATETETPQKDDFYRWIDSSKRKGKPFTEYSSVMEAAIEGQSSDQISVEETQEQAGPVDVIEQARDMSYGASNKIVSKDRYEELKKRMKVKLGQLNSGFDPETFAIGAEMAAYHLEAGARKFADFASRMVADLGNAVVPYLKSFYDGARRFPGMEEYAKEMDSADYVTEYDVNLLLPHETQPAEPSQKIPVATLGTLTEDKDTRDNSDLFVVKPSERTDDAGFRALKQKAKDNNGYYSRFKKGFIFRTREDAENFNRIETVQKPMQETVSEPVSENIPKTVPEQPMEAPMERRRPEKITESNGYRIGDVVIYKGKPAKITDFEYDGRPVLDVGMAPVMYEIVSFNDITKAEDQNLEPENIFEPKKIENEQTDEQTAADTVSIGEQTDAVTSEAETIAESAESTKEVNQISDSIDDTLEQVNKQLVLLGYYEADYDDSQFHESFGYMKTAEKKAIKDIDRLAKQLASDLGIKVGRKVLAKANIAPAGGDIYFRLPLKEGNELYVVVHLNPDNMDNLNINNGWNGGIMYRIDKNSDNKSEGVTYGENMFANSDVTYDEFLIQVRSHVKGLIPEQVTDVIETAMKIAKKSRKTQEKEVNSPMLGGLFAELDTINTDRNEKDTRTETETKSGAEDMGVDAAGTDGGIQTEGNKTTTAGEQSGRKSDGNGTGGSGIQETVDEGRVSSVRSERLGKAEPSGRVSNTRIVKTSNEKDNPLNTRNYIYPENSFEIDNLTPSKRFEANINALETLVRIIEEGRQATEEEKDVLARFRGWGGIDEAKYAYSTWQLRSSNNQYAQRLAAVINRLDPNGEKDLLSAIRESALTSYYTPTDIARAINGFISKAGYRSGSILDPSMGSGIFEGTIQKDIQQHSAISGIEFDWLTGNIAKYLYPDANIRIDGYQNSNMPKDAFDVVMSNIPFGSYGVNDKSWNRDSSPVKKAAQRKIHNYFVVKMLENTKPGGLCVIMTSNAVMDTKSNQIIREHIADEAEILGAIRLPDNTFKGAGTAVVTDLIFLRKYRNTEDKQNTTMDQQYSEGILRPFLSSQNMKLTNRNGDTYDVPVNAYFSANPDMMIGSPVAGGQYSADAFGLTSDMTTSQIAEAIEGLIDRQIIRGRSGLFDTHHSTAAVVQAVRESYTGSGDFVGSGNIVEQDGKIGILTASKNSYGETERQFEEIKGLDKKKDRIRSYMSLRTALKQLISEEISGADDTRLSELRKSLKNAYDSFVKKYGKLVEKENDFIDSDIDGFTVRGLEKYDGGKFTGLSDIFTKKTIKATLDLSNIKTPHEAIAVSLSEYGDINPSFMEKILGEDWSSQCGDALYLVPFTDGRYETRDKYLSGDVKSKLEDARVAAESDSRFNANVSALEAVQPAMIPIEDISIRMGARWVPDDIYTDFLVETLGVFTYDRRKTGVKYIPELDSFVVDIQADRLGGKAKQWETGRKSAKEIFIAALEDKTIFVYDTLSDGTKVLNSEQTDLANEKVADLRTEFEDWISLDAKRVNELETIYNDKFNRVVLRKYDGSHLNIAGLQGKELRPHQKDAVWMLINNRGGIIDHIVGAGKTLVMQSAIMEMRRMGIAKKPMIIALKSTVAQIAKEFREAFPSARVLAPTEKDFATVNRKKFLSNIAVNDYDCIILSHEQYTQLPHTEEIERQSIDEQMEQIENAIEYLYGTGDKSQLTKKQIKGLESRKKNLEAKLEKLLDRKTDREFTFEALGIDYLFVDECQQFKSLPYVTSYNNVAGLSDPKGSQRAVALLNGVRYLQKLHQGDRGSIFLSGTTITNSLVEIYNLFQYLRPNEMARLGFNTFDAWASNFALRSSELEYGVTNELKEKNRFRNFDNVAELSKMYAEIADVRNDSNLQLPKPKPHINIVTVQQSDAVAEINSAIVDMVQSKNGSYFGIQGKYNTPWGLLASTLSTKAAISPRLIDPDIEDDGGKVAAVCENVKKIYDKFSEQKGTQLIFLDTGIPEQGKKYDAYNDIINRLVEQYGIPREEIVDIHVADNDKKRKELFNKVNDGKVRILIGGTKNMGTGVNVQKRIVALHHVDVPWTPADREQREGRGVRQGNEIARDFNNNQVEIFFYAMEGSLDMYKYQLQDAKGKMFAQFKTGTVGERSFDEGNSEDDGFNPAEIVALLSGNPVIFEKSKMDKKVEKLRRSKRAYESEWARKKGVYDDAVTRRGNMQNLIRLNEQDRKFIERKGFVPGQNGKYPLEITVFDKNVPFSTEKTFTKAKEAGEYIHKLLKEGKQVGMSSFGMSADITLSSEMFDGREVSLNAPSGIKYTTKLSDDATAAGQVMRTLLTKVIDNADVYKLNFDKYDSIVRDANPGEKNFPKQAELDEALAEQKRLDAEYNKLAKKENQTKDSGTPGLEESKTTYVKNSDGSETSIEYVGNIAESEGKTSLVERTYRENGYFNFTGKEKISTVQDVAFIFKQLENYAIENAFVAMIKDGKPVVIHIGMGNINQSIIDYSAIKLAYDTIRPESVYMVHNHPSGQLVASSNDVKSLNTLMDMFPEGIVKDGIIINTVSGQFLTFNSIKSRKEDMPTRQRNIADIKVLSFDKNVFSKDYKPGEFQIRSSEDVAKVISSQRFGTRGKVSYLVLNYSNQVIGNVHTTYVSSDAEGLADEIATNVASMGGSHVILYGSGVKTGYSAFNALQNQIKALSGQSITLLDTITTKGNVIVDTVNEDSPEYDGEIRFRKVTDKDELDMLNSQSTIKAYRAMQVIDGKLYPPMAASIGGKMVDPIELGVWEKSVENPELAVPDIDRKTGKQKVDKNGELVWKFILDKGGKDATGKKATQIPARYNPYIHTSRSPLNDQFKSAWIRPNLVTVEVEVPESELTSGYKAERAKDAVGEVEWKSGSVSGQLAEIGKPRKVILSRWDRPVRVLNNEEVAERISELIGDSGISIPENVVTPSLRAELEKKGVKIDGPEKGVKKTDQIKEAIAAGLLVDNDVRFSGSDSISADNLYRYTRRGNINMSERANEALEEGKTDVGTNIHFANFISNNDLGEFDGEYHHVGNDFNIHYFVTLNEGVTLSKARKEYKEYKAKQDGDEVRELLKQYPEAISEDQLESAGAKVYPDVNPTHLAIAYAGGKLWYSPINIDRNRFIDNNGKSVGSLYNMSLIAEETASKLHLDNVEIVTDASKLDGEKKKAKGFYNTKTRKITVVVQNHIDAEDIQMTILHEAVGHKGLRGLVGENNVDDFAMKLFENSDEKIKREILSLAEQHNWRISVAVEEYIATQAETVDFNNKVKQFFVKVADLLRNLLESIGIKFSRPLSLRDTRWLLWQSYNSLNKDDIFVQARRAVLASRLGFDFRTANEMADSVQQIRMRAKDDSMVYSAAEYYNNSMRSGLGMLREVYQEQYRSLEKLIEAVVKQTGREVEGWENPMYALNRLSSMNYAEKSSMVTRYLTPIWDTVGKIMDRAGVTFDDVNKYVQVKSGLERNEVFAKRDARNEYVSEYNRRLRDIREEFDKKVKESNDMADMSVRTDFLDKAEKSRDKKQKTAENWLQGKLNDIENGTDPKYMEKRKNDYSGIIAWFSTFNPVSPRGETESEESYLQRLRSARKPIYDSLEETEDAAKDYVDQFEKDADNVTDTLWDSIRAANNATLKHQFDAGMITKQQYDSLRNMMEYYVPLRGFSDKTAEDIYTYFNESNNNEFSNPIIAAKGRKTQAESPFGYIGTMMEAAVQADNKNKAKMALYYFVTRRPDNDLVSVSKTWYEKTGETDYEGKPVFREVYPGITDGMSAADVSEAVARFNEEMWEKEKNGDAFRGEKKLRLSNGIVNIEKSSVPEHVITVNIAGEKYNIIVNGNPRAAQAVNGFLNRDNSRSHDKALDKVTVVTRYMAMINTSLNPEFMMRNFMRDMGFSFMGISVREGEKYLSKYTSNWVRAFMVFSLIRKHKNGQTAGSYYEKMYEDFVNNGGVTGYTRLVSNVEYDDIIEKFLRQRKMREHAITKAWQGFVDGLVTVSEGVESISRFAAFITSREMGRSIEQSIKDAKEVTVNFNTKGSGQSLSWDEVNRLEFTGNPAVQYMKKVMTYIAALPAPFVRSLYVFFNASVQGLANFANIVGSNPAKASAWIGAAVALGFMNALMHALMDDDDDYLQIPDYERRSNIMLGGGGYYFKWALPQEAVPFFSIGDIMANMMMGKAEHKNVPMEIFQAFGELSPLNPFGEGGLSLREVTPTALQPFYDIWQNTTFTGSPLYRDMPWDKDDPAYLRVYNGTSPVLISISKGLNSVTGGDYATVGGIGNSPWVNPASWEHIYESYTGGIGTFFNRMMKTAAMPFSDEDINYRDIPFVNKIFVSNDDRYRDTYTNDVYQYWKSEAEDTDLRLKKYEKAYDADKMNMILSSPEYERMLIFKSYEKRIEFYNDLIKQESGYSDRKELVQTQDEIKRELNNRLANTR